MSHEAIREKKVTIEGLVVVDACSARLTTMVP